MFWKFVGIFSSLLGIDNNFSMKFKNLEILKSYKFGKFVVYTSY